MDNETADTTWNDFKSNLKLSKKNFARSRIRDQKSKPHLFLDKNS